MTPREGEAFFSSAMTLTASRLSAPAKSRTPSAFLTAMRRTASGRMRLRWSMAERRASTMRSSTVPDLASALIVQRLQLSPLATGKGILVCAPVDVNLAEERGATPSFLRSEEHTSELQSLAYLVCRLLLEK